MALFLTLTLAALPVVLSAAIDQPFYGNASLLTGTFSTISPCRKMFGSDRFKTGTFINVRNATLTYGPPSCPSCDADNPSKPCYERIELLITRKYAMPWVARYPLTYISQEKVSTGASCATEQQPVYSWPVGAGRPLFIAAVKEMASGAKKIASFTCAVYAERYKNNSEAEAFVSYLVTLAYELSFSAF